jgi:hypothetical protein
MVLDRQIPTRGIFKLLLPRIQLLEVHPLHSGENLSVY